MSTFSVCLVFDPELFTVPLVFFTFLTPIFRLQNKYELIWDLKKIWKLSENKCERLLSISFLIDGFSSDHPPPFSFSFVPPVDVHRASRSLPDDVRRSGPIRRRRRRRSSQRRRSMINTPTLCLLNVHR